MSHILDVKKDKTLRLNNVIGCKMEGDDFSLFVKTVEQMENYIKSKGSLPMGPIIQHTKTSVDENGQFYAPCFVAGLAFKVSFSKRTCTLYATT